jgi:hypothetical protein
MNDKTPYTYTVLRYVHDVATGEFLNVGVALLAPEQRYVKVMCRTTYGRLAAAFPSLDGESFRAVMRHVIKEFERFQLELADQLPLHSMNGGVMAYAHMVLGADDSSLQWSQAGAGLTVDPSQTLTQLYNRFVTSHELSLQPHRRHDEDIWRRFSRELEQRQVLKHFVKKTIAVDDDQVEFKHAWKNGVWHCLAPVSFDLATADSIREKAHKWLGQLTSVAQAKNDFKLYFLVGEPTQDELRSAFHSALRILSKSPIEKEVVTETQMSELCKRLAADVQAHKQSPRGH